MGSDASVQRESAKPHRREPQIVAAIYSSIAQRWRELVGFTLLFRVFESVLCAPLVALVGKWLLGRTVLDSTAVISFLLSPRGMLAFLLTAIALLTIRLVEHAGLSVIFPGSFEGRRISAREAARVVWRHLLDLVRLSGRFVVISLVCLLPLLAISGAFAAWLLPRHDINYYLKLRPTEFTLAAVVIGLAGAITSVVFVMLVVRWRWVVQAVLFERANSREAFRRSAALTQGIRGKLVGVLVAVCLFSLLLGFVASFLGTAGASLLLSLMGQGVASLAIAFGVLLLLRALIGAACTFVGSCVDAGAFTLLYRRRVDLVGGNVSIPAANTNETPPPQWFVPAFAAALLVFAAGGAWFGLEAISEVRPITIHAHRGVFTDAPENTLAAVRAAIAARADYLETDIQLSKDGVPVVVHDSDFSRLGGVARKVWELTYAEIRAIPLGLHSTAEFRNEVTPSLDELLSEAKGRIKLNIELKYYSAPQPSLVHKVIEAVRAHEMLDQVVIQCPEYEPLQEVRRLAPEIPIGYLLSFNAREPSRLQVDFLSVEQNRVNRSFISTAHRRGQQVYTWTVNSAEDMQRQFELGIDGVITDQSALARKTLDEYLARPRLERSVANVRAWLAD